MSGAAESGSDGPSTAPWRRGLLWLAFLAPFFFLTYGLANQAAAARGAAASYVFAWERHIPFLPWTIIPYWSIDLLYGLSFLACRTRRDTDRHGLRLLTLQLICVAFFLAFPLRFSFERPSADGLFGALFDALASFDQPYNQAPSLHIAIATVLWQRFASVSGPRLRMLTGAWFLLICVSVLTTYQHHFIDIPTGAGVGFLVLWIWPDHGPSPLAALRLAASPSRRQIAAFYFGGALAAAGGAAAGGLALLLWPVALALGFVALIYGGTGATGFQKSQGRRSLAATALLAPYLAGTWLNSRLWTLRTGRLPDPVDDGVWLGPMPSAKAMRRHSFAALCDLTAELSPPRGPWRYAGLPWLDLIVPTAEELTQAARAIEELRRGGGPVLVCCALGRGRSARAMAAWLLLTGRARNAGEAIHHVQSRRQGVRLGPSDQVALDRAHANWASVPCASVRARQAGG